MNSSSSCHEIPDCPRLYVDAFRGKYLHRTHDASNTFILTHYHGDHYGNLPKEYKYQGPAKIHCTPVTAALLRGVHGVPEQFVVEHPYGETWTYHHPPPTYTNNAASIGGERSDDVVSTTAMTTAQSNNNSNRDVKTNDAQLFSVTASSSSSSSNGSDSVVVANITFYDANHCPGAAIILFEMPNGNAVHLHTGDMRYHTKMKSYPRLQDAVLKQKMDCVLLDTTYANPKHDFIPQEAAIESIAHQVRDLLYIRKDDDGDGATTTTTTTTANAQSKSSSNDLATTTEPKSDRRNTTLVLLSCYSIGKEKVLWDVSNITNQSIYVSERKLRMLLCIQGYAQESISSQIVHRTTRDPNASDIHVIPMDMAGELWPYFQPNYWKCAEYAQELNHASTNRKKQAYDKVVAFIPTGWADASNWNKKNAISCKRCHDIDVEIRLISYSEHSTYSELQTFVNFLQPRKVIPTVYKDENDRRKIEARFSIDTNRAKQHFFRSMTTATTWPTKKNIKKIHEATTIGSITNQAVAFTPLRQGIHDSSATTSTGASSIATLTPSSKKMKLSNSPTIVENYKDEIASLQAMGFDVEDARAAIESCNGNLQAAVECLLQNIGARQPKKNRENDRSISTGSSIIDLSNDDSIHDRMPKAETVTPPKRNSKSRQQSTIRSFFGKKK